MHIGAGGARQGFTEWLNERMHIWEKPETMGIIQQGALEADHSSVPSGIKEAWLRPNEQNQPNLSHS